MEELTIRRKKADNERNWKVITDKFIRLYPCPKLAKHC